MQMSNRRGDGEANEVDSNSPTANSGLLLRKPSNQIMNIIISCPLCPMIKIKI